MNDAEETTCFRNKLQIFGEGLWLFSRPQSWLGVKYHLSMYFKLSKGLFGMLTATSSISLNDMFGRKGESDLFSHSPDCTTDWTAGSSWQGNNWLVNTHWSVWSACSVIIQSPHLFYFCCSYNKGLLLEIHWRRATLHILEPHLTSLTIHPQYRTAWTWSFCMNRIQMDNLPCLGTWMQSGHC